MSLVEKKGQLGGERALGWESGTLSSNLGSDNAINLTSGTGLYLSKSFYIYYLTDQMCSVDIISMRQIEMRPWRGGLPYSLLGVTVEQLGREKVMEAKA